MKPNGVTAMNDHDYDNMISDWDSLEGHNRAGYEDSVREEEAARTEETLDDLEEEYAHSDEEKKAIAYIRKYGPLRGTTEELIELADDDPDELLQYVLDAYREANDDAQNENERLGLNYDSPSLGDPWWTHR